MNNLFDSHCHLEDERFDVDRADVVRRMAEQGVIACTCVGSDIVTSKKCLLMADTYELAYAAVGVHPHEAKGAGNSYLQEIETMLEHPRAVALGEIGLDFYYDHSPRDIQKTVFTEQLDLAWQLKRPVILHVRDAHGEVLDMLRGRKKTLPTGIVHCFSGSAESAIEYVRLGFHVSFSGPVTFKNARKLKEAAMAVPMDRLLIETDSPYLSPEPMRGKRNEPAYVRWVCEQLASLRDMPAQQMADITNQNAQIVYGLNL